MTQTVAERMRADNTSEDKVSLQQCEPHLVFRWTLKVALDQRDTRLTNRCPRRQTQRVYKRIAERARLSPEALSRTKLHEVLYVAA